MDRNLKPLTLEENKVALDQALRMLHFNVEKKKILQTRLDILKVMEPNMFKANSPQAEFEENTDYIMTIQDLTLVSTEEQIFNLDLVIEGNQIQIQDLNDTITALENQEQEETEQ